MFAVQKCLYRFFQLYVPLIINLFYLKSKQQTLRIFFEVYEIIISFCFIYLIGRHWKQVILIVLDHVTLVRCQISHVGFQGLKSKILLQIFPAVWPYCITLRLQKASTEQMGGVIQVSDFVFSVSKNFMETFSGTFFTFFSFFSFCKFQNWRNTFGISAGDVISNIRTKVTPRTFQVYIPVLCPTHIQCKHPHLCQFTFWYCLNTIHQFIHTLLPPPLSIFSFSLIL